MATMEQKKKSTGAGNGRQQSRRKKKSRRRRGLQFLLLALILILTAAAIYAAVYFIADYKRKNTFEYKYNMGLEYYETGNYDKALANIDKALGFEDAGADKLMLASELKYSVLIAKKDYNGAIKTVLKMLEVQKTSERYTRLMELYSLTGNYLQMEQLAKQLEGTEFNEVYMKYMVGSVSASVKGGNYTEYVSVELTASKPDLVIHYTLDGSMPTAESDIYNNPISFREEGTYTLRAMGINANGIISDELFETYVITLPRPNKPTVTADTGVYTEAVTVEVNDIEEGCKAYYTLDGTKPDSTSEEYTEPFALPAGNYVLRLVVIDEKGLESEEVWRIYEYMPETAYSYGAAVLKVKKRLIEKDIMLDMDGNTDMGARVIVNLIDVMRIDESEKEYYVFQITSEYNKMTETLSGYYAIGTDDGELVEVDSIETVQQVQQEEENVPDIES